MHVAVPPDVKFTHIGAEFPSALDEDIEWHAQQIESTSRIYRAAKRKNEPEAALKDKAKQLYEAIKDMFKSRTCLSTSSTSRTRSSRTSCATSKTATLRTKRAKAYGKLETVHRKIEKASWDKQYGRPRE